MIVLYSTSVEPPLPAMKPWLSKAPLLTISPPPPASVPPPLRSSSEPRSPSTLTALNTMPWLLLGDSAVSLGTPP